MKKKLIFSGKRPLPMIYQTEAAECGLACLAMVAGMHGTELDLPGIRAKFSVSLKRIDLASRPLKLELDQLKDLQLPCILHWGMNHFVVLQSVKANSVVIHDPARGIRKLNFDETSKYFTGVALELLPTPDFQAKNARRRVSLIDLFGRLIGVKSQMTQIFIISLALQVCALGS
jgi:ATP-binding cassette, subfamily B, bacterial CvaB/MchF/RaxB